MSLRTFTANLTQSTSASGSSGWFYVGEMAKISLIVSVTGDNTAAGTVSVNVSNDAATGGGSQEVRNRLDALHEAAALARAQAETARVTHDALQTRAQEAAAAELRAERGVLAGHRAGRADLDLGERRSRRESQRCDGERAVKPSHRSLPFCLSTGVEDCRELSAAPPSAASLCADRAKDIAAPSAVFG